MTNNTQEIDLNILYEDNHIVVINKPAGMLTQGDYSGNISLFEHIKKYLKIKYNKPGNVYLGMIHRLDKPVSGTIMFAKTSKAAKRLCNQIKAHKNIKIYIAITENSKNTPISNKWVTLKNYLIREKDKTIVLKEYNKNSQIAELKYKQICKTESFTINIIQLLTGRKHQIRAQLSNIGAPIVGDKKYNSKSNYENDSIALHSYCFGLSHPITKEFININSEIPVSFNSLLSDKITDSEIYTILNHEIRNIMDNNYL